MNPKRESQHSSRDHNHTVVIHVSELMAQIKKLAGIRQRIQDHYYDQPEVLAQIAEQIGRRVRT
jgi:hypothetical protein